MCCPKRFVPIFWGFWGLLISIGYRSVVSIVLVHIVKSEGNSNKDKDPRFLGLYCSVNASLDLSKDWTVSSTQYLHCAYYAGSLSTQLLGGYLASRFSSKRVCGITILVSSVLLLIIPTAIKVHFALVVVIRLVQGVFEGCSVPALNGVISAWTPKSEKSRMITIVYSGAYLSPAVAMAVSGITGCVVSWNASLYIYGGCGVLWSVIWLVFIYDTPSQHSGLRLKERMLFEREGARVQQGSNTIAEKIPWRKIFSSLPMWAIVVGSFCRNWIFSLIMMGIPPYFEAAFTTNIAEIGLEVAIPEVLMTIMTVTGGVLIDILIKSHLVSTTVGRKIAQCIGFGVEACCILGLRFIDRREIVLIVLSVGVAFSGLAISGYQVNPLDLAPQYASLLTGLSRLGTLGAVLSTLISGILKPESITVWQNIFTIAGSVHLAGVVFYGIFASGERQNWIVDGETKPLINPTTEEAEVNITDSEKNLTSSMKYQNEENDAADWFLISI